MDDELLDRVRALALAEAAKDRSAKLALAKPWRFRDFLEDAARLLRGAPLKEPLPVEAWRYAAQPKLHRSALKKLAKKVARHPNWDLSAAREIEADPAVLALWVSQPVQQRREPSHEILERGSSFEVTMSVGGARLPQLVHAGLVPPRSEVARMLERWARDVPGHPGARHATNDNFDAAVLCLAYAYGAVAGRSEETVLAASLSNAGHGAQTDTGPVPRFIRSALPLLAPQTPLPLGPQTISDALRRCRALVQGPE